MSNAATDAGAITMPVNNRLRGIQLPVGYFDGSGSVHREAVIRKMTGHEEELLYDLTLSPASLVSALIESCLVQLEGIDAIDSQLVRDLYTADRNYLLLEIRRFTLGDRLQAAYRCPGCETDFTVLDDLSQLKVTRLESSSRPHDIVIEIEDGYQDREGQLHNSITMTLPRGADEEFVAPMVDRDPLKARDALTLRCIRSFGTLPPSALEAYGVRILRDLTLGDRQRIEAALNDQTPGVDLWHEAVCPCCERQFLTELDLTHFFSSSPVVTPFAGKFSTWPTTSTGRMNPS